MSSATNDASLHVSKRQAMPWYSAGGADASSSHRFVTDSGQLGCCLDEDDQDLEQWPIRVLS